MILPFLVLFLAAYSIRPIYDVIVIGAGVAGLRASQILSNHRISHIILQSTNQTGGRVRPLDFAGIKVDKGASFIHKADQSNPIGKLAKQLRWPVSNGTCSFKVVYLQGLKEKSLPWEIIASARKQYFKLSKQIEERYDEDQGVSLFQAVQEGMGNKPFKMLDPLKKQLVRWMFQMLGNIDGASLNHISEYNADYNQTKPDLFPLPGYYKLIDAIFPVQKRALVYFNQRVQEIDYRGDVIKVKTQDSEYFAKKVICSTSIGVLKADKIVFHPPLPQSHRNSIQKIGFGVANKLFASFSKPFWNKGDRWLSFLSKSGQKRYPSAFVVPRTDKNILIFFVSGKESIQISSWSENEVRKDLERFLVLFKDKSEIMLEQVKQTQWHLQEDFLGSYTFYKVETTTRDFKMLANPIDNKLWLAGEHTAPGLNSFVHGAYISGERVAKQIYQDLNK